MEVWHIDIIDFLNMRKKNGDLNFRCLNLFSCVFINKLFM